MCAVSMVMDMGQRDLWGPNTFLERPWTPFPQTQPQPFPWVAPPIPVETTEQKLREFLKFYEAAKEYDRQTKQPDCEDPAKMQVLDRILERLAEIEKRLSIAG